LKETRVPLVNVMVNGRAYTLACDDGEEDHLKELAGLVDEKVRELLGSVGQVGDQRLLLMASLLMADELHEAGVRLEEATNELAALQRAHSDQNDELDKSRVVAADALEAATRRLQDVAEKLATA
jgi:cell division protein ZapA